MKTLSLRLTDELHENLRQEAFDRRLSISEVIRQKVDNYYATDPSKPLLFNKLSSEVVSANISPDLIAQINTPQSARPQKMAPDPYGQVQTMGQLPPIQVDATSRDTESIPQPQMKPEHQS